jgi:hypothetical protein
VLLDAQALKSNAAVADAADDARIAGAVSAVAVSEVEEAAAKKDTRSAVAVAEAMEQVLLPLTLTPKLKKLRSAVAEPLKTKSSKLR